MSYGSAVGDGGERMLGPCLHLQRCLSFISTMELMLCFGQPLWLSFHRMCHLSLLWLCAQAASANWAVCACQSCWLLPGLDVSAAATAGAVLCGSVVLSFARAVCCSSFYGCSRFCACELSFNSAFWLP